MSDVITINGKEYKIKDAIEEVSTNDGIYTFRILTTADGFRHYYDTNNYEILGDEVRMNYFTMPKEIFDLCKEKWITKEE